MYKYIILLFFLLQTSCTTFKKIDRPFFWEVKKNNKTFYILGSIHRFVSSQELPDYIFDKIKTTNVFVMESLPRSQRSNLLVSSKYISSKYYSVKKLLTEEEWEQLKFIYSVQLRRELKKADVRNLDKLKLEHVLLLCKSHYIKNIMKYLLEEVYEKGFELDPEENKAFSRAQKKFHNQYSIDAELLDFAHKKKRALQELDLNYKLMNKVSVQLDTLVLKMTLKNIRKFNIEPLVALKKFQTEVIEDSKLIEYYRSGDISLIQKNKSHRVPQELEKNLIDDRNLEWIEAIDWFFNIYESGVIVVGVSHIVKGQNNLIHLLEKRGYTVNRYNPPLNYTNSIK